MGSSHSREIYPKLARRDATRLGMTFLDDLTGRGSNEAWDERAAHELELGTATRMIQPRGNCLHSQTPHWMSQGLFKNCKCK